MKAASFKPRKILFANVPFDGHFNPLTGLAVHLKELGHDVRWYNAKVYAPKLERLGIPYYPYRRAIEMNQFNLEETFPERRNYKGQISKLKFDIRNSFVLRATEYYEDIRTIHDEFPFDLLIADIAFTGIAFVKEKMKKPVLSVGVFPYGESSRDLPPNGLGMLPSDSLLGRWKQNMLRRLTDKLIFSDSKKHADRLFAAHGIPLVKGNIFDVNIRMSSLLLQIGTPGFEYRRSDMSPNVRFAGALLPHRKMQEAELFFKDKLKAYRKVVLVTQGTVEKDTEKIVVPTLEAFRGTDYFVVATTGGSNTEELRRRFPEQNLVIEDFIPFEAIMPHADVYVTNGGYGGVMMSIQNELPMVVAGIHEGKNEINARVEYFGLGINLRTERPKPAQIRESVSRILADDSFNRNIVTLSREFSRYDPLTICEEAVEELLKK